MSKIHIICGRCGGENISKDAVAEWCPDSQAWVLKSTQDFESCDDCEAEGDAFATRRIVDEA